MSIEISLIVAVAENGVIGQNGVMPWQLSTDLKRFKEITMGKPIVMGRKTWASIGRPLPGRANIVVTRDPDFRAEGAIIAHSFSLAKRFACGEAEFSGVDEIFVIGGGEIYKTALPFAKRMYVTEVLAKIEGDTHFPSFEPNEWRAVHAEMVPAGEKDNYPTRFVVFERI